MIGWAEKYRPETLDEIVGNPTAVAELRKWAAAWDKGRPDKRAVILQGDPGIGKTSAALALANEMGWSAIEMNASESRNAEAIRKIATRGAVLQTFTETGEFVRAKEGGRKLIILDEADNVFGREDKGGIGAIVEMIQETRQPVVLIANDYYALTRRSSSLKRLCKTIKFQGVHEDAMKNILRTIASKEGVEVADDVLEVIVRSGDARRARDAVRELDESPEDLILWVDQNLGHEYGRPDDLVRGYEALSRADIYLGRTRRRQRYGLWSYASEMMSSGVAVARKGRARGSQLQFPYYLIQMSRSRAQRGARNSVAKKLAQALHVSQSTVRTDLLPTIRMLYAGDEELRIQLTAELALDEREVAFLLGESETSHAVKHLLEKAAKIKGLPGRESGSGRLSSFGEEDDAG